ncbi:phosphocholine cytidylyltransferase family protein [Desulfobacca acetoxidans]
MIAVILSAGVGRRLAPLTESIPKALIEVGGRPLIWHTLVALRYFGVSEVVLVVGHRRELLQKQLRSGFSGITLHWVENEHYAQTGSLYSLWLSRGYLGGPFLFMDADLLFNPFILAGLPEWTERSRLLVGPLDHDSGEEVKVYQEQGLAVAIGKNVRVQAPLAGEALGIISVAAADAPLAISLMDALIRMAPQTEHEELSQALCQHRRLWVEDIGHQAWLEIDFLEDVSRARQEVWPAIQQQVATVGRQDIFADS